MESNKGRKKRRSSILKPPKARQPLQDVDFNQSAAADDVTINNTRTRRVSFSGTHIKEFHSDAEVVTLWGSSYEEKLKPDVSHPTDSSRYSEAMGHSSFNFKRNVSYSTDKSKCLMNSRMATNDNSRLRKQKCVIVRKSATQMLVKDKSKQVCQSVHNSEGQRLPPSGIFSNVQEFNEYLRNNANNFDVRLSELYSSESGTNTGFTSFSQSDISDDVFENVQPEPLESNCRIALCNEQSLSVNNNLQNKKQQTIDCSKLNDMDLTDMTGNLSLGSNFKNIALPSNDDTTSLSKLYRQSIKRTHLTDRNEASIVLPALNKSNNILHDSSMELTNVIENSFNKSRFGCFSDDLDDTSEIYDVRWRKDASILDEIMKSPKRKYSRRMSDMELTEVITPSCNSFHQVNVGDLFDYVRNEDALRLGSVRHNHRLKHADIAERQDPSKTSDMNGERCDLSKRKTSVSNILEFQKSPGCNYFLSSELAYKNKITENIYNNFDEIGSQKSKMYRRASHSKSQHLNDISSMEFTKVMGVGNKLPFDPNEFFNCKYDNLIKISKPLMTKPLNESDMELTNNISLFPGYKNCDYGEQDLSNEQVFSNDQFISGKKSNNIASSTHDSSDMELTENIQYLPRNQYLQLSRGSHYGQFPINECATGHPQSSDYRSSEQIYNKDYVESERNTNLLFNDRIIFDSKQNNSNMELTAVVNSHPESKVIHYVQKESPKITALSRSIHHTKCGINYSDMEMTDVVNSLRKTRDILDDNNSNLESPEIAASFRSIHHTEHSINNSDMQLTAVVNSSPENRGISYVKRNESCSDSDLAEVSFVSKSIHHGINDSDMELTEIVKNLLPESGNHLSVNHGESNSGVDLTEVATITKSRNGPNCSDTEDINLTANKYSKYNANKGNESDMELTGNVNVFLESRNINDIGDMELPSHVSLSPQSKQIDCSKQNSSLSDMELTENVSLFSENVNIGNDHERSNVIENEHRENMSVMKSTDSNSYFTSDKRFFFGKQDGNDSDMELTGNVNVNLSSESGSVHQTKHHGNKDNMKFIGNKSQQSHCSEQYLNDGNMEMAENFVLPQQCRNPYRDKPDENKKNMKFAENQNIHWNNRDESHVELTNDVNLLFDKPSIHSIAVHINEDSVKSRENILQNPINSSINGPHSHTTNERKEKSLQYGKYDAKRHIYQPASGESLTDDSCNNPESVVVSYVKEIRNKTEMKLTENVNLLSECEGVHYNKYQKLDSELYARSFDGENIGQVKFGIQSLPGSDKCSKETVLNDKSSSAIVTDNEVLFHKQPYKNNLVEKCDDSDITNLIKSEVNSDEVGDHGVVMNFTMTEPINKEGAVVKCVLEKKTVTYSVKVKIKSKGVLPETKSEVLNESSVKVNNLPCIDENSDCESKLRNTANELENKSESNAKTANPDSPSNNPEKVSISAVHSNLDGTLQSIKKKVDVRSEEILPIVKTRKVPDIVTNILERNAISKENILSVSLRVPNCSYENVSQIDETTQSYMDDTYKLLMAHVSLPSMNFDPPMLNLKSKHFEDEMKGKLAYDKRLSPDQFKNTNIPSISCYSATDESFSPTKDFMLEVKEAGSFENVAENNLEEQGTKTSHHEMSSNFSGNATTKDNTVKERYVVVDHENSVLNTESVTSESLQSKVDRSTGDSSVLLERVVKVEEASVANKSLLKSNDLNLETATEKLAEDNEVLLIKQNWCDEIPNNDEVSVYENGGLLQDNKESYSETEIKGNFSCEKNCPDGELQCPSEELYCSSQALQCPSEELHYSGKELHFSEICNLSAYSNIDILRPVERNLMLVTPLEDTKINSVSESFINKQQQNEMSNEISIDKSDRYETSHVENERNVELIETNMLTFESSSSCEAENQKQHIIQSSDSEVNITPMKKTANETECPEEKHEERYKSFLIDENAVSPHESCRKEIDLQHSTSGTGISFKNLFKSSANEKLSPHNIQDSKNTSGFTVEQEKSVIVCNTSSLISEYDSASQERLENENFNEEESNSELRSSLLEHEDYISVNESSQTQAYSVDNYISLSQAETNNSKQQVTGMNVYTERESFHGDVVDNKYQAAVKDMPPESMFKTSPKIIQSNDLFSDRHVEKDSVPDYSALSMLNIHGTPKSNTSILSIYSLTSEEEIDYKNIFSERLKDMEVDIISPARDRICDAHLNRSTVHVSHNTSGKEIEDCHIALKRKSCEKDLSVYLLDVDQHNRMGFSEELQAAVNSSCINKNSCAVPLTEAGKCEESLKGNKSCESSNMVKNAENKYETSQSNLKHVLAKSSVYSADQITPNFSEEINQTKSSVCFENSMKNSTMNDSSNISKLKRSEPVFHLNPHPETSKSTSHIRSSNVHQEFSTRNESNLMESYDKHYLSKINDSPADSSLKMSAFLTDKNVIASDGCIDNILEISIESPHTPKVEDEIRQAANKDDCLWTIKHMSTPKWIFQFLFQSLDLVFEFAEPSKIDGSTEAKTILKVYLFSRLTDKSDQLAHLVQYSLLSKFTPDIFTQLCSTNLDVLRVLELFSISVERSLNFMMDVDFLECTMMARLCDKRITLGFDSLKVLLSFEVTVDLSSWEELSPSDVKISVNVGDIDQKDVQNLVLSAQKGPHMLRDYIRLIKNYIRTVELYS